MLRRMPTFMKNFLVAPSTSIVPIRKVCTQALLPDEVTEMISLRGNARRCFSHMYGVSISNRQRDFKPAPEFKHSPARTLASRSAPGSKVGISASFAAMSGAISSDMANFATRMRVIIN